MLNVKQNWKGLYWKYGLACFFLNWHFSLAYVQVMLNMDSELILDRLSQNYMYFYEIINWLRQPVLAYMELITRKLWCRLGQIKFVNQGYLSWNTIHKRHCLLCFSFIAPILSTIIEPLTSSEFQIFSVHLPHLCGLYRLIVQ